MAVEFTNPNVMGTIIALAGILPIIGHLAKSGITYVGGQLMSVGNSNSGPVAIIHADRNATVSGTEIPQAAIPLPKDITTMAAAQEVLNKMNLDNYRA